jgi:DNA (cytosine-5)-methyltransferase 1
MSVAANDDFAPARRDALKAVDLFAGAGGFSLGAIRAGFDLVGALELSPHAAATYRQNIRQYGRHPKLIEADILETAPRAAMSRWQLKEGECDIVLGGPPCQGFSTHRLSGSGVGDPRNDLLLRYFDFVAAIRPRVFLMENVPGLLWTRHQSHLDLFLEMADVTGYEVETPMVLNAADYGVPQRRKRVFILGVAKRSQVSLPWPPPVTHCDPKLAASAGALMPWKGCAVAFARPRRSDPNNVHMRSSNELIKAFMATPINGGSRRDSGRVLPCHEDHDGHSDVYGRIDPAKPAPTMTTACINPSKGRFVHPTEPRGITIREAARMQTFPEQFFFSGGLMAAGVQIGNAIPVDLASRLLSPIHQALAGGMHLDAVLRREQNR